MLDKLCDECFVTNITKTYHAPTATNSNALTEEDTKTSRLQPPDLNEIKEISHTPKVWVLFLLLSAAVVSLWAILWAVVSLCRTD